jgi:hypothetical protein
MKVQNVKDIFTIGMKYNILIDNALESGYNGNIYKSDYLS